MLRFFKNKIHQSWFVVAVCIGVVVGVVFGVALKVRFFDSAIWLILVVGLLIFVYFVPKAGFLLVALIAGTILALFRISEGFYGEDYMRQFYKQNIQVTGIVDGNPETDEKGTSFKLKNLRFGDGCIKIEEENLLEGIGEKCHRVAGNLYVLVAKNENLMRADMITLSGKLSEGFGTFGGYMYKPMVVKIKRPEPGDLVLGIRNWFAGRIKKLISGQEVDLGLSYLLGMKTGLSDELSENLRMVGLVHIVVASGAHLSILVGIARKIFGKISRFAGLFFAILFIVFFMVMVGFTPSIVRAGVMSILTIVAWYVGRKFAAWRIILIVAAGTLVFNPMYIINLGWLLSFASFAGIMVIGPRFEKFFYGNKKPKFIASIIITTISATLMTLPITLYYFGTVSLISVLANLLILPTLPYAMGLVFLTGVVAGAPGVETLVAFLASKLLSFHIIIVNFFGDMRQFVIEIEPYQMWVFLIYMVVLLPLAIGLMRRKMVKLREEEY